MIGDLLIALGMVAASVIISATAYRLAGTIKRPEPIKQEFTVVGPELPSSPPVQPQNIAPTAPGPERQVDWRPLPVSDDPPTQPRPRGAP